MKLDAKDRELVALLCANARLTNRELARRIGLSPSACLSRVKRLEANGVILGYRAVIAREPGGRLQGIADVRLIDPESSDASQFAHLVETTPEIVEAHRIAGRYDYLIRFSASSLDAWTRFHAALEALGCASQARFSVLLDSLK